MRLVTAFLAASALLGCGESSSGSATPERAEEAAEASRRPEARPGDEVKPVAPAAADPAPPSVTLAGVAAGGDATCAWSSAGALRCAGTLANPDGEGSVPVEGIGEVAELATDGVRACAREAAGTVKCWTRDTPPREIDEAKGATQLAVGEDVSCAVVEGNVWCWSPDVDPKRYFDRAEARFIAVASSVKRVHAIDDAGRRYEVHSTGFVQNIIDATRGHDIGAARIIGRNDLYLIVDAEGRSTNERVKLPEGFVPEAVYAGGRCGRKASGELGCHGARLTRWERNASHWTPLTGVNEARMLAAGDHHVCALDGASRLWCMGDADEGQLGQAPPRRTTLSPTRAGIEGVTHVYRDGRELCVLAGSERKCSQDPAFATWGDSEYDSATPSAGAVFARDGGGLWAAPYERRRIELGSGTFARLPKGAKSVTAIAGDLSFACLTFDDGRVGCLDDDDLELGVDKKDSIPEMVPGLVGGPQLRANAYGACSRDEEGTVSCVGAHRNWESALPTFAGDVPEVFFEDVESFALVDGSVCARAAGTVQCKTVRLATPPPKPRGWVVPTQAEEGAPRPKTITAITKVEALDDATHLLSHGTVLCGIVRESTLRCVVELARLIDAERPRVVEVSMPAPIEGLAVGRGHACARLRDGTVHCFGDVGADRLGKPAIEPTPIDVTARFLGP